MYITLGFKVSPITLYQSFLYQQIQTLQSCDDHPNLLLPIVRLENVNGHLIFESK